MNKAQIFLKRHSSTILTVVGSIGVITTTVLAVKATPKALELIEDEKNRKNNELLEEALDDGHEICSQIDKLEPLEIVKVAWKPYIPAVISGLSTIACIFGANYLSVKKQASLMSAYALLDSTYNEYRKRIRELHEEDSVKVEHEIIKAKFDKNTKLDDDKILFFDDKSMRYFESTWEDVKNAEEAFNESFVMSGFSYLNDFYELLGIPIVDYGYNIGWYPLDGGIEFKHEKAVMDDGLECWIIQMCYPPESECSC